MVVRCLSANKRDNAVIEYPKTAKRSVTENEIQNVPFFSGYYARIKTILQAEKYVKYKYIVNIGNISNTAKTVKYTDL